MGQFNGPIQNIELLAPGAQTTTQVSATQQNSCYKGAIFYLNVSAASGTGGLTLQLWATDPVSGVNVIISALGSAKTATGTYVYAVYPSYNLAGVNGAALVYPLPSNWFARVVAGDGTSYTYSLSADLIP